MGRILFLFLTLAACATKPTPYQKEKSNEGYSDTSREQLRIATFKANSVTKPEKAQNYAEFRAIKMCLESAHKHANIIDINDRSVKKDVVRTSGSGWGPSYGFGMYPYYSRYSSFGVGVNYSSIQTDSYSETLLYPVMEVYYTCSDKIVRPEILMKEISAEQMKLLVKDLKGALQVEQVADQSPNTQVIETGDIILKANGKRIEKVYELIRLFQDENSKVVVNFMREGEKKTATLKAVDITESALAAEKQIISKVCKLKKDSKQETLKKEKLCNS